MARDVVSGRTAASELPADLKRVLAGPCVAHFATVMAGRAHVTPVWIESAANGLDLKIDIGASTQKAANLRHCTTVCISLTDPDCSSTWYTIDGYVFATKLLTTDENIQRLAIRNLGRRRRNPELPRLLVTVRPTKILGESTAYTRST